MHFRALWGPKRSRKKEINHHGQRVYGGIVRLDQIFHQGCIAFHRSIVKTGPTCMKRRKRIIIFWGIWLNLVLTGWFFFKLWLKVLHKKMISFIYCGKNFVKLHNYGLLILIPRNFCWCQNENFVKNFMKTE